MKAAVLKQVAMWTLVVVLAGCAEGNSPHGALPKFTVAGSVAGPGNVNATMTLQGPGGPRTTKTDVSGAYQFLNVETGSYTLTTLQKGFAYSPPAQVLQVQAKELKVAQIISVAAEKTSAVGGTVSGGAPVGVVLTLKRGEEFAGSTLTVEGGVFRIDGVLDGNYTLTPSLPGYAFTPQSQVVTVAGEAIAGKDFTSTAVPFPVGGTVSGDVKAGVTLTLVGNGKTLTATSDSLGVFSVSNVFSGTYTLTPSLAGYKFIPATRTVTMNGATMTGQDFHTLALGWKERSPAGKNVDWQRVAVSADGKFVAAVVNNGHVYTSGDYGVTWQDRSSGSIASDLQWVGIAISDDGQFLTAVVYGGHLYTSSDYGVTWQDKSTGTIAANKYWRAVAMSSDGKFQVAIVKEGEVYVSSNNGSTWEDKSSALNTNNTQLNNLGMSGDGKFLGVGTEGGHLYVSSNYGATWADKSSGVIAGKFSWSAIAISDDGKHLAASSTSAYGTGVAAAVVTSDDSGTTWKNRTSFIKDGNYSWNYLAMSGDGKFIATSRSPGPVYDSSDFGFSWKNLNEGAFPEQEWLSLAISDDGKTLIGGVYSGSLYTYVAP